jgi:uncharacterized protein
MHGNFVWYELMTSDAKAAEKFYTTVVGWTAKDAGMPGMAYTLLSAGDAQVAGAMTVPPEICAAGWQPGWVGHIGVSDVDDYTKRVTQAGGKVHREPTDIPGIGRFSVVADPQGANYMMFKGSGEMPKPPAPMTPGTIGWHELHATDGAKAFDFYSGLYGWKKRDAMDMGPMGVYQIFATSDAAQDMGMGGMMTDAQSPTPYWLYYFSVPSITAAVTRVIDNGGKILHGPVEVPGGMWIINGQDPQGVTFALVGPKG